MDAQLREAFAGLCRRAQDGGLSAGKVGREVAALFSELGVSPGDEGGGGAALPAPSPGAKLTRLHARAAPGGATTGRADIAARLTPAAVAGMPGRSSTTVVRRSTTVVRRTAFHVFLPAR